MALGETQNGIATSTVDIKDPKAQIITDPTQFTQQQNNEKNGQLESSHHQMMASSKQNPNDRNAAAAKSGKQTDANISFLRAARSGDMGKVIEFIESGQVIDINTCNANGLNALHLAAKDGYIDIVNELLRRGANVDNATKKGNTALHIASLAGQKEVIKFLIQYNANVNVQSLNGFTPLYMAAQENHDACVRYLLSKGANPSLATEDGFTPLAVAMQQGHDKVVAVLLESDSRGKVRLPALHIAAKKDDVKAASLLLENDHNPDIVSKSGFTPLHIAAHYGNVDIANLLIDKGADVNFTAKHNITPLHVACKWGKTNILQLLLTKGARIDSTTRDGLTPLHCAARSGHDKVIEILLKKDAPILLKTKNGLAPLHMAAQGEHDEAAQILLMHKAPVDEVTVDYLTALHVAAHCGHVKVAKLLLDYNADPNARALNGFTPLHIACKKNRIKVVELLLKHNASISATTESGLTPLHVASFMGCMNIVIYLLQHDANPDAPTVRGETPLHLAARANQTDIIRILLRNGSQVDVKAREGQTPLHVASRLGNIDIVMLLLQHGANVDSTTKDMYTPLHIAAKEGQEEVATVLIENQASLDATTKKGFSSLHLASKYGNVSIAQLLLQKGAAIDEQGKNGVTPLHVASHYDHQNVAFLLLGKGASPHTSAKNGHTALHIAAKKNQMEIATNLLQYGADPNDESKSGFTPLHLATQEGHIDMVNLLLEHGANVNSTAKNGLTPMHLCAQEDETEVAKVLFQQSAKIDERTKAGYTPLHIAAHYGQIQMVKFLLENDANIELSTNIGFTPLHQAAQQGHTLIINLLLTNKANPNALTHSGQTALNIANKLGYVTAVETLKIVTETSITNTVTGVLEEKYKVTAPESMHETFMSDSEDEGGEDHLDQHQYKYMATDDLKTMNDQNKYDTTDDDQPDGSGGFVNGTTNKKVVNETVSSEYVNQEVNAFKPYPIKTIDNVNIVRPPIHVGFLVSFLVDARGGAMRGCRHSGVRVIVPPRSCAQPTRITCRYVKPQRIPNAPPLMEGEALVSRVLELSPVEAKFLGPVILEVPHFGSLRDKEREIIILRSDNGETWREHTLYDSEEAVRDVLNDTFESTELNQLEDLHTSRIIRVVTHDFPHFFAVVSRIRQEVHAIGPDGGTVSSTAVPQVQAIFPPNALTKKIRVGLQAQPVELNGCAKLLGQGVAVSPVVTVEPRRRKFHKAITLSIPAPRAHTQGMVNQYSGNAPTLRLLCSITGGQNRAVWEDVTGSTPLTFVKDSVSFTTTVSARFWLMDCRNISDASRMATELYTYMTQVPFMVKFVVFAKRISQTEAKLSIFCMTDDKEDKTLEQQEYFTEIAKSRDVEVLEDQPLYLEFGGNLIPVMKSGDQLNMKFHAFRENRLSFLIHVKDQEEPFGRVSFMSSAKVCKGEPPLTPLCTLNVTLANEKIIDDDRRSLNSSQKSLDRSNGNNLGVVLNGGYRNLPTQPIIHKADIRLSDICNLLANDWAKLARELQIPESDIQLIYTEYPENSSQQAMVMLRLWLRQAGPVANGNNLQQALHKIDRSDIVDKCIFKMELVTDETEKVVAKMQLDQTELEGLVDESSFEVSLPTNQTLDETLGSIGKLNESAVGGYNEQKNNLPAPAEPNALHNLKQPSFEDEKRDEVAEFNSKFDHDVNNQHNQVEEKINKELLKKTLNIGDKVSSSSTKESTHEACSTPPPTPIEEIDNLGLDLVVAEHGISKEQNVSQNNQPVEEKSKEIDDFIVRKMDEVIPPGHKPGYIPGEKPVVIKRYVAEEIIPNETEDLAKEIFQNLEMSAKLKLLEGSSVVKNVKHIEGESLTKLKFQDQLINNDDDVETELLFPAKAKTIKKHSKVIKQISSQQMPYRPNVGDIEWDLPINSITSNVDQSLPQCISSNWEENISITTKNFGNISPTSLNCDDIKEISTLNLENVIESGLEPNFSHEPIVISPSDDYSGDIDELILVQTTDSMDDVNIPNVSEQIITNRAVTRNLDGSENIVITTDQLKYGEDGIEVLVRKTVTERKLVDGTTLTPDVSVEIMNSNMTGSFGGEGGFTASGCSAGGDSPFFIQNKSKTSSSKSSENNINKTFESSSDSDIALHEPGVELSDDEEQTEADFYHQVDQNVAPNTTSSHTIVETLSNDDNGVETLTTTTTIITNNGKTITNVSSPEDALIQQLSSEILPTTKIPIPIGDATTTTMTTTTTTIIDNYGEPKCPLTENVEITVKNELNDTEKRDSMQNVVDQFMNEEKNHS